jgi:hypothetical protein
MLQNNPSLQGNFKLTNEQKARFAFYSPNEQDIRNTITARHFTQDNSAGTTTEEQNKYFSLLKYLIK